MAALVNIRATALACAFAIAVTACSGGTTASSSSSASTAASPGETLAAAASPGASGQTTVDARSFNFDGRVLGSGAPIANATVTAFWATAGEPQQLAQSQSDDGGKFSLSVSTPGGPSGSLYVVARGGKPTAHAGGDANSAIALLAVLGTAPPPHVTIDEFTTIASAWTSAQFLDGAGIRGPGLSLNIAASNVPNFVDLQTGGYGEAILGPLNGGQTPTMAHFATLADVMAGCIARVTQDACRKFFAASAGPAGNAPNDTLAAATAIARNQWYEPARVFALLNQFYPVPKGKNLRPAPFLPYLSVAPSAWTLPLKFEGSVGSARIVFDSRGNAWVGSNFIVGSQGTDALWDGNLAKYAPNGKLLSPMATGFAGGGLLGPGYGTAVDANDRVWITSTNGSTISLFDNDGKPISPDQGYNFGGKLGFMQGIAVAPNGDVWMNDFGKDDVVYLPQGDPSKVKFYCDAAPGKPNSDSPCKLNSPFYLAIDQQNRVWVDNAIGDTVARFPASDPRKVQVFSTGGFSGKGMGIDSKGNVWIANTIGSGLSVEEKLRLLALKVKHSNAMHQTVLAYLLAHPHLGSVSELLPSGKPAPGSPFNPGSIWGAWAIAIDGDDHVWISNFAPNGGITELCGARTETCPPGMKTGDAISPKGGYMGGGMQMLVDVNVDPAGNVWVSNNWQEYQACFAQAPEALSTRCGGEGVTIFYGLAAPVKAPQIGPAQHV
jgi:hypothetical protein